MSLKIIRNISVLKDLFGLFDAVIITSLSDIRDAVAPWSLQHCMQPVNKSIKILAAANDLIN